MEANIEKDLSVALEKFDFVRFSFADIHGISRSRTISKSSFVKSFKNGTSAYIGVVGLGLNGDLGPCLEIYTQHPDIKDKYVGNLTAVPSPGTLHLLPTAGVDKYIVGQVLCDTVLAWNQEPHLECPRYIAKREIQKLESMGYRIYGSFEMEFLLLNKATLDPVFTNGGEMFSSSTFGQHEKVLLEIMTSLEKMGVEVEGTNTEYSEGQFELVLKPQLGILIADNTFLAKDCVKDVARKHGYIAVFMTKMKKGGMCNGFHFNHSLQVDNSIRTEEKFPFSDQNCNDLLSDVFRSWLGGLVQHFPSLNALCSPTVNCYRRLGKPLSPNLSNWGIEDRFSSFRVKTESPAATYIESRMPSAACNPYLVLAATIIAGRDGLEKGLPCPLPRLDCIPEASKKDYMQMDVKKVPTTLQEAISELNKDEVLVNSLGHLFVKWFCDLKQTEMKHLEKCDVTKEEEEMFSLERGLYMLPC